MSGPLDGVTFPAAEIKLEFLEPGGGEDDEGGAMFPTGNVMDRLDIPGIGNIEATLINAGNPTIFIDAAALGLKGCEMQNDVNRNSQLLARCETIRAHAAVAMGLGTNPEEVSLKRPHTPKLAFVSEPQTYEASSGKAVRKEDVDLTARILSMGQLHHAMTGTGAVAISVAAAIPGTVVNRLIGNNKRDQVRFGHPSGTLAVGAEAAEVDGVWTVTKAVMSRSARRLMEGWVCVPSDAIA